MNEKDIEEKAEQFEAALEGLMCAMEELRKDRDRLKKLADRPRGRWNGYRADEKDWQRTDGSPVFLTCSECKKTVMNNGSQFWNFCPSCGAKMDAEGEE